MSEICCPSQVEGRSQSRAYGRVLWIVVGVNLVMFIIEMIAGLSAGSVSLQADSLDFLGDTANYGISLFVAGMALRRARMRVRLAVIFRETKIRGAFSIELERHVDDRGTFARVWCARARFERIRFERIRFEPHRCERIRRERDESERIRLARIRRKERNERRIGLGLRARARRIGRAR